MKNQLIPVKSLADFRFASLIPSETNLTASQKAASELIVCLDDMIQKTPLEFRDFILRAFSSFGLPINYLETFDLIRSVIPAGDTSPALGIVAHTRKPKNDEKTSGRGLSNLISGSYVLTSVPRSVFVIQHASDEPEENRIIWTCCKNNDGELGFRSAWERRNGLFVPVDNFNWDEFDTPGEKRRSITEDDLITLFDSGKTKVSKKQAVEKLMEQTGSGDSAAYNALSLTGRFGSHLQLDENKLLTWKP
jgi:hypothetical protein